MNKLQIVQKRYPLKDTIYLTFYWKIKRILLQNCKCTFIDVSAYSPTVKLYSDHIL